jgi:hypothetical protein
MERTHDVAVTGDVFDLFDTLSSVRTRELIIIIPLAELRPARLLRVAAQALCIDAW